ncbi:MAG: hypothetical protein A2X32_08710 [Elusimicrobia bacterium GWC2_64_44]|nr:MAG: hypothetical protein A2X32_08710 [Elusimicrobia bacterium GWC2_64_44]
MACGPQLFAAGKKAAKPPRWVVHKFNSWEISTPEGFGFRLGQTGETYREWVRDWDKQYLSRPDAEGWLSYSERISVIIGRNAATNCGTVPLPLSGGDPSTGQDRTKVTPVIEGSHYGIPSRKFTVLSEKTDRGEKCMEHNYAAEDVSGGDGAIERVEVVYTYALTYPRDLAPPAAMREVSNGGPNYQTYLQMLATLKPLKQKAGPVRQGSQGAKYGTIPIIK